jgi:ABC-type multidrug transport system ATPase subunit
MDEAERCTHVALLHEGSLLASGEPSELRAALRDGASLEDVFVARLASKDVTV